jgi:hypothetical protein
MGLENCSLVFEQASEQDINNLDRKEFLPKKAWGFIEDF